MVVGVVVGVVLGTVTVLVTVGVGGCVTVAVGALIVMFVEAAVEWVFAVLAASVVDFLPSDPPLTASATPTPAAATTSTARIASQVFDLAFSCLPQLGQDSASAETPAPQFGQNLAGLEPGGGDWLDISCRCPRRRPSGLAEAGAARERTAPGSS